MCTLNQRVCSTRQKGGVRCGSVRAPSVDPAEVLGSLIPPQSKSWCEGKSRCCCGPSAREAVPGAGMWKRAHALHPLRVLLGGIGGMAVRPRVQRLRLGNADAAERRWCLIPSGSHTSRSISSPSGTRITTSRRHQSHLRRVRKVSAGRKYPSDSWS